MALVGFGNCVYISHSEIGAALGCHPRTVGRALKYLVQNKWVVARKAEFGSSNLYTLNSHLVWSGKREFLKMSKLKDPLMIGGQEQPFLVKLPRSEWARPRREVEGNTGRPDDPRQADGTRAMVRWGPRRRDCVLKPPAISDACIIQASHYNLDTASTPVIILNCAVPRAVHRNAFPP